MKTNHRKRNQTRQGQTREGFADTDPGLLLAQDRLLFQTLIDHLPDRIYVKDIEGRKLICNKSDAEVSGGSCPEDVLGKTDFDTYDRELAAKYWADDKAVLDSGKAIVNREEPGLDANGKQVWVISTKVPLRDSLGQVLGLIGIGREITSLKVAETRLKILADMARRASSTLDLDGLLRQVLGLIDDQFHFYHVGIYLRDDSSDALTLRSAAGHSASELIASRLSVPWNGSSQIARVARSGDHHLEGNLTGAPDFIPSTLLPESRSEAIFPLRLGRKVIGVLDVHSNRADGLQKDDIAILVTLADQIAMAIQNASLYKHALLRTEQLQKLSQATADIVGQLGKTSLDEILALIAKYAAEILEAEVCGVLVVRRKGFLRLEASHGHRQGEFPKGLELKIESGPGTGLTGHIACKRKLFNKYGDELSTHFAVRRREQSHLPSRQCYSLLAIPLFRGLGRRATLVGLLRAENKKKDGHASTAVHFTEADEWILTVFATTVVVAIDGAQLVDQIQRARRAGQEIAKVSTIGRYDDTLRSIVEGARSALGCEISTLYTYDDHTKRFLRHQGVGCADDNMIPPEKVAEGSTLEKIIHGEKSVYIAEDVPHEALFHGRFARNEGVRSTLAVKLRFVNRPMGVLFIAHRQHHRFTRDEIEVAQQFGHQAAIAIRNTQLYQEAHRLFELLRGMNAAMTSSRPLEETLSLIIERAVKMSGIVGQMADYGYIALVEGNRLQYRVAWPRKGLTQLKQKIGDIDLEGEDRIGITGMAVRQGRSIKVDDVSREPSYICINENIRSELAVPIRHEEKVIGVINLEHHNPGAFEDYDVYALQNLAAQVAITIQMIRHYEQINHDALVREGLLKVGEAILITQEPHKVLQILVDKIKEALQADVVTLYTHDRTGPKDSLQANYAGTLMNPGTTAKLLKIRRDSVVRRILHDGIPIFASDTLHDPFMALGDFAREERIRSSAGIPLLIGDEKVGVFFVNYRRPHQFSDRQQDDFLLFATQAALAIQNALRFEDLKKQKSLVGSRTALAFMGLANSVWGHSIEGNVINIRNLATLMLQDLKEEGVPAGLLTRLAGRVDLIKSQAQEVLDKEMIPKLSIENAQVILLNDMIRERVEQLKSLGAYKSISFRLGLRADVRVKTAPEWLRTALDILIDNAAKAMQDAPKKSISIRTIVAGSLVKIAVKDTGKGIAPDLLDRILSRQIVRDNQEGLGMGLLLAQAIMQAYNGDIELLETGPKGTTFLMLLPVVA